MYSSEIDIVKSQESRLASLDLKNLTFGKTFSDHMLFALYEDGKWSKVEIKPYGALSVMPSLMSFHYGQTIFEGMKAFKDEDGKVFLFRPEENWKRFNKSAVRMAMPEVPETIYMDGLKKLLSLDHAWVPKGRGNSLYIRPFMISFENGVSAAPANKYAFMIIMSPVTSYYKGKLKVLIAEKFSRAVDGGVGFAKAGGNYGASFYPTNLAKEQGFQQIIWTDACTHQFVEEAGTMNLFFRINDTLLTAPTGDRILDGVTRKSIIQLAKDHGIEVEVRKISVAELIEAANNSSLKEVFGSGTAAVVAPIEAFSYQEKLYELPEVNNGFAERFKKILNDIQYNAAPDPHAWRVEVNL